MSSRLPLFPLGQPLFPGVRLNLQIFEQRYLRLVRASMRDATSFGIVAIAEGGEVGETPEIFEYGLEVNIVDWRQQDNGLLGVSVAGDRCFRVLDAKQEEDGLMIGEIEWLPDSIEAESIPAASLEGLENLLRELARHPSLGWVELPEDQLSVSELGWKLAQALPISHEQKVPLLAEVDAAKRLARIQIFVDELSSL